MSKNYGTTIKGEKKCVMEIPEEENNDGEKY